MTGAPVVAHALFTPDADWPPWPSASFIDRAAIHVLRIDLCGLRNRSAADSRLLSTDEQARAARYLLEHVRQRYIACRAAVRRILSGLLDCRPELLQFGYGPHGKPHLQAPPPHNLAFNVAHSEDVALLACGWDCTLGIDVEAIQPRGWQTLARRFFSPEECTQLESLPPDLQPRGFYQVWTGKEAYLKATGRGMSLPLGAFGVNADPRLPPRLTAVAHDPAEPLRWQMLAVDPAPDYAAALMWNGAARPVCRWTWTAIGNP
jgi:4'-phosphopantetheinyl transferase